MRAARLLFVGVMLLAATVEAAESDPFWAWRHPPDDATRCVDRAINRGLVRGLALVNAQRPSTCQEAARLLTQPLSITSHHFFRSELRRWPMDRSPSTLGDAFSFGTGPVTEFSEGSTYRNAPLFPFGHWVPLDPTLRVDDVLIGPDKIGHFFTNGLRSWDRALRRDDDDDDDDDDGLRAALLYGIEEEKGWLGFGIDGVFSFADLHAAAAGVRFFDSLCTGGGLQRHADGRWTLERPFTLASWVDPCWDESFQTNAFAEREAVPVRDAIRELCPLLDDNDVRARRERYRARSCHPRTTTLLAGFVQDGIAPDPARWDIEQICLRP
ncbi:MAG: hypothetical protein Q8O67_21690 [Deltaproteobacteria bacterium]|nr:hypothetical protein [Deltaproteobacteria bacterium]